MVCKIQVISGGEGSSATRHKFLKCELIDSSENSLKIELEIRAWFKTEAGVKCLNKTTYNVQSDNYDSRQSGGEHYHI